MTNMEIETALKNVSFLVGDIETVAGISKLPALEPFTTEMLEMLNEVSRLLMDNSEAKQYSDVVTYAFWIRKASLLKLKEQFYKKDGDIHLGRGVAFHIAPSNVPVNFAYSLATGLLTGNANVVRVPSKDFQQVEIISNAFRVVLAQEKYTLLKPYVCLVKYAREKGINDLFSSIADTRIIWGGDDTIAEIRKSPLAPRAMDITFADRFSLAVIDSESLHVMSCEERNRIAGEFYNDTYLTDQNACTSPRLVVWLGNCTDRVREVRDDFWGRLHKVVENKYRFQSIQGVNKLASGCLAAAKYAANLSMDLCGPKHEIDISESSTLSSKNSCGVKIEPHADNLLVRVKTPQIMDGLMDLKDNSGYFFEYECTDILDLKGLCNDKRCQTISYIGDKCMLSPLLVSGIRGVDRVVPVGQTMDFSLIWDGYNLYERFTRTISLI